MTRFDQTGRLFVFGCSMTCYNYPTWADILGDNWAHYENWGEIGAGNQYIFNSVIECATRNQFTEKDTILVLWSGLSRIDAYQYNGWIHLHDQFCHDKEFACCPDGYEIMSYAWMAAIDELLTNRACSYVPMTWSDYDLASFAGCVYNRVLSKQTKIDYQPNNRPYILNNRQEFTQYWADLYHRLAGPDWPSLEKIYDNNIQGVSDAIAKEIAEFYQLIDSDKRWKLKKEKIDSHPTPLQHLEIVRKYFPSVFVKNSTEVWINDIEHKMLSNQPFDFHCQKPKYRL